MPETERAVESATEIHLPNPGDVVAGRYVVSSILGKGGMGIVYKVEHAFLGTSHALKVLTTIESSATARFQKEARISQRLRHKNLVAVTDFGLVLDAVPFLVLDYVDGKSLSAHLRERKRLPWREALTLFVQICDGLEFAHENGVVHRDLKPSNFMLVADGDNLTVKIIDFGIAKMFESENSQSLTRTGEVFGSPLYMSPEQCIGTEVSGRSDIYSLGCALFETLAGRPPFASDNALATMMKHQFDAPPKLADVFREESNSKPDWPQYLEEVVETMLAKDPAYRFQEVAHVRSAFVDLLAGRKGNTTRARVGGRSRLLVPLVITVVLAVAASAGLAVLFKKSGVQPKRISGTEERCPLLSPTGENAKPNSPYFSDLSMEEARRLGKAWTFYFPKPDVPLPLGTLHAYVPDARSKTGEQFEVKAAFDSMTLCTRPFKFLAGLILAKPDLFRKFRADEIYELYLADHAGLQVTDDLFHYIEHLTSIKRLDIAGVDVTDKCLPSIDKLSSLISLHLNGTRITPSGLASQSFFRDRLLCFSMDRYQGDRRQLIDAILTSKSLRTLVLSDCKLDDADLKRLAQRKIFPALNISNNPSITNAGLANLAGVTFKDLDLHGCRLTSKCIDHLAKIKIDECLIIDDSSWSESDKARLKAILPGRVKSFKQPKSTNVIQALKEGLEN